MFYCSPCPTAAPALLNIHVVSTNFAKTLVGKLNMTSHCNVTNSVYPVTMTTIHHCSILEFGRGASNQAIAPGITRPLHATAPIELALLLTHRVQHLNIRTTRVTLGTALSYSLEFGSQPPVSSQSYT